MIIKNKKVYLLLAGGTILSESEPAAVEKESDVKDWFLSMPELAVMAQVEPIFISGENSGESGPKLWQKISAAVFDRLDKADGFIITSRPAQALFNAIALSFAVLNINQPAVFTGSQLPILKKELAERKKGFGGGLGLKANLINAVQMATTSLGAVGLLFGNRCLWPAKTRQGAVYSLNAFETVDESYLAKVDFGISPAEKINLPQNKPILKNQFEEKVLALKYYPGLQVGGLKQLVAGYRGLFIEGLALEPFAGEFLKGLAALKMPIVVFNRFYVPPLNKDNLIEIYNLTKETALVKFMWALGQSSKPSEVRGLMFNEYCGEFIKR